jgi:hypothetical protein
MLTAVTHRNLTSSWTRGHRNTEASQGILSGSESKTPMVIQNDLAKPEAGDCDEPKSFLLILLSALGTLPA